MELLDENFKKLKEKSQKYAAWFGNRASTMETIKDKNLDAIK
jgi:hypothetical protein